MGMKEVISPRQGQGDCLQHDTDHSMCLALRFRISGAIPLLPWPSLHFVEGDNYTITACFVVNCVRSLIPQGCGVLQKFYDSVHSPSKPLVGKLTSWNADFTFLRGAFKMNVKSRKIYNLWNKSLFLKLTYLEHLMPHGDITFDPSHGDVFPCPAPNCEQT